MQVTNLNYQPEKAGTDKEVPRVDLSFAMIAGELMVEEFVRVRNGTNVLKALWDKGGSTVILDAKPIELDIEYSGKAELSFVNAPDDMERLSFDPARIKKIKVEPRNGREAEIHFQLRVDPGEHLNALGDLRLEKQAMFMFTGSEKDDPDSGKQRDISDPPE